MRALDALAALAPGEDRPKRIHAYEGSVRWLPLRNLGAFAVPDGVSGLAVGGGGAQSDRRIQSLITRQLLHPDDQILHIGWLWVCGLDPEIGRISTPLATAPITLEERQRAFGERRGDGFDRMTLVADSELELASALVLENAPFLDDPPVDLPGLIGQTEPWWFEQTDALRADFDRISAWAAGAVAGLGLSSVPPLIGADDPFVHDSRMQTAAVGLKLVVGLGLYQQEPNIDQASAGASLRVWRSIPSDASAFAAIYGTPESVPEGGDAPNPVMEGIRSPFPLTPTQELAVTTALGQRLSVVSGPPGTGKSQVVVATALEAVARGRSVLVAASSDAAVNALAELFESAPGPDPMVARSSIRRRELADQLASGRTHWVTPDDLAQRRRAHDDAQRNEQRIRRSIATLLDQEVAAAELTDAVVGACRATAPGLFDPDADLDRFASWLDRAEPDAGSSWFSRWRQRRNTRRLQNVARCPTPVAMSEMREMLGVARQRRASADLEAAGGLDLSTSWPDLAEAVTRLRQASGELIEGLTHDRSRADRGSIRATASIAAALRAGRIQRRRKIAEVAPAELTSAIPLWVSTTRDLDDLLPRAAAMFDLVIIDEASQVDQVSAAGALLRARSAVVIGDPHQLRHVSFVSDERIAEAIDEFDLGGTDAAALLDVRRLSLFDLVAGTVPVLELDEHFRSRPHLIEFSAQRFYGGRLDVATRHPDVDGVDAIDVVEVSGRRIDGVNSTEVSKVVELLRADLLAGRSSVGVITPFRDQHDALEQVFTDELRLREMADLRLRLGTVHGFQGGQRDRVYVSLALDDDSAAGSLRFVNDPNLFNVMITRAREEMVVLTSGGAGDEGLLHDYLQHADGVQPNSATPASATTPSPWAVAVMAELEHAGVRASTRYRAGRHVVDLVIERADRPPIAVICGVHPDGADEHIARHLHLLHNRWAVVEVFESRWKGRLAEFAVGLTTPPVSPACSNLR